MTSVLTVQNLATLESEQRWLDLLDAAKKFVTQSTPDQSFGYYYQGIAYHELKQFNYAMDCFDEAIKMNDSNSLFYNARGLLEKDLRHYDKAIQQFELAAERKPEILNPILNKAQTLSLLNKNDEAVAIYNLLLTRYPDYVPAMIFKGESLKELGRHAEAVAVYEQAIALEPNAADLVFNKGNIYANQGNLQAALECYNKAIQLDPEFPDAYYHVGLINHRLGRRTDAINNLQRAIRQNSATPMPRIALAELYSQSGDTRQAQQIMDEAISDYPDSPFSHYNSGIFRLSQGDVQGSSRDFVNAINHLDEPDLAKKQLLRISADNEAELNRISGALQTRSSGPQKVSINYSSVTDGLIVKKENQADIANNFREIKKRIWDLEPSAEGRTNLDAQLVALQQSNPTLFEYVIKLLRMERNYLYSTNLNLPKASYAPTSINFLRNSQELPALDYYTRDDLGMELVMKGAGSPLTQDEFKERTRQALGATRKGYDPEDTHFRVSQAILDKVHSSDQKNREIYNYDTNERSKKLIENVLTLYPKLGPDVTSAASAVALKDFILMNNFLASTAVISDQARLPYEKNFESAYGSGQYENMAGSTLFGGTIDNFASFQKTKRAKNLSVVVRLKNDQNAESKSEFFICVNISYMGKVYKPIPPNSADFPEVFRSTTKPLRTFVDFEFDLPEAMIKSDRMDTTFLRVLVLKKKSNKVGERLKKADEWVALQQINKYPIRIGSFKQKKMLSSKTIEVMVSGTQPDE